MSLEKLSVLERAAKAYATGEESSTQELSEQIYPDGKYPMVVNEAYPLPLHLFSPRLAALLRRDEDHLDARKIWDLISSRENIIRMITATEIERTAAESLGKQLEVLYPKEKDGALNTKRKQMIGYMIKVVMEIFGYKVYRNRMQITTLRKGADPEKRKSNYFYTASRYVKMDSKDRDEWLKEIDDPKLKAVFKELINLIIKEKTEYQQLYDIDGLANWDILSTKGD